MPAIENVKLTGTLPKGPNNGLSGIAYNPDDNYPDSFLIVAEFVPHKITTDLDSEELTLTLRASRIECLVGAARERAQQLLADHYAARTGQTPPLNFTGSDDQDGGDDD
jgi:hypothetical protein